jgi:hypothetical protein
MGDTADLRRYASALERPAEFAWRGASSAVVRATMRANEVLSVQNSWHPGWRASVSGRSVPVRPDGLGLTVVEPSCDGPCEIQLEYVGGAELWGCHALRWLTVAFLGTLTFRRISRRSRGE